MPVGFLAAPLVVLFLAAVCLVWAAATDAAHYKIPNSACLVLLVLYPLFVFVSPTPVDWKAALIVAGVLLLVGFILFARNAVGAGDVKLISVMGLWAGVPLLGVFLVITTVAGGLLSLCKMGQVFLKRHKAQDQKEVSLSKIPVPYGIAISIGGFAVLMDLARPILFPV